MPLVANVGRKAPHVRLLVGSLYGVLTLGAVTMVYPFLLMISGSFKSNVDKNDFDIFPAFFTDSKVLFCKHLECKYNNALTEFNHANRTKAYEFRLVEPPAKVVEQRVRDWKEFEAAYRPPGHLYFLGYTAHLGDPLELWKRREFRQRLMGMTNGDLGEFNRRFEAHAESWVAVGQVLERLTERRYQLTGNPLEEEFYRFKAEQPAWFRYYPSLDGKFVQTYLEPKYGREIEEYNRKHDTNWKSYSDVVLSRTAPENELECKEWAHFVREELNLQFIRVVEEARPLLSKLLQEQYQGDIKLLNQRYGARFASFDEVTYPDDTIHASERLVDWAEFVKTVPVECLRVQSPEIGYRDFLKTKYGADLAALNKAHGEAGYAAFEAVPMPTLEVDYADFLANERPIRWELMTANYKQVFDYIVLHGNSLLNTAIYCLLAVTVSLTVNPLAAYALSRFNLPSTYKILLFCMATMAFPAAVTMIPSFLLIQKLGLLNTYAALVLPGMANGFGIFLLKGFFDSLPRELYESATIDGAGEWTMFWNLSMALSTPILAVLALSAFTAAYGNFMFAFILCPDEKMWTLMVFLYQLQYRGHMGLTFAALLVAAIPTFLVFVFCQNIIIRGIVVPVEK
jgi:multiple sugar transport system permease protein